MVLFRGPWDVSTYGGTPAEGYVPQAFYLLRWSQSDLIRDPKACREIDEVFSLRAQPQPLNIISEANLKSCGLTPVDSEDKADEVQPTTILTIATLTSPAAPGSVAEPSPVVGVPPPSTPFADEEDASGYSKLVHQGKTSVEPIHQTKVYTSAKPITIAPGKWFCFRVLLPYFLFTYSDLSSTSSFCRGP